MEIRQKESTASMSVSDEHIFERLHADTWSVLFQIAYKKLGDQDEAYDLLQELFMELWDKRQIYPLQTLSLPWLKKRLWFKLMTYFREQGFKQRHLEHLRVFVASESLVLQPAESVGVVSESDFEIIMQAISIEVAQMPDRMKEIFLLNREQHFTISEIAQKLGLSPNTVRNQLHTAMKRLRKSLEAHDLTAINLTFLCWMIWS